MPLTSSVSPAITTRFLEVQEVLSFIQKGELAPPARDPNEIRLLRGLLYVQLYGAFEFSVNRIVSRAVQAINAAQVPHNNVTHALCVLALDRNFNAISQSGKNWQQRLDLIKRRLSPDIAQIDDGSMQTQNIWLHTIKEIFDIFGIVKPVMFNVAKQGYITEVIDTRNKIAHGEDSPIVHGSLKRCVDLQVVHDAIRDEAFYILDCFNEYLKNSSYKLVP